MPAHSERSHRGEQRLARLPIDLLAACTAVAVVTLFGRLVGLNAASVGFIYLLAALGIAVRRGLAAGVTTSVVATGCYNFYFLPPFGTLSIEDPANWVALSSLLVAALAGSQLVAATRRQADVAAQRRQELEQLYDLCFGLLTADPSPDSLRDTAARAFTILGASSGALLLGPQAGRLDLATGDGALADADDPALARALAGELLLRGEGEQRLAFVPLHVGEAISGVLVVRGGAAPEQVLEPAGRLLGLAIERAALTAETTRAEALRQSEALKTALLRAVSHDLRTPLTGMQLALTALARRTPEPSTELATLARERDRLARRIDNLLTLARLEANAARPHPEAVPAGSLWRQTREALELALVGRPVETHVDPDCPEIRVDPTLALELMVNLVENALRAGPTDRPLELWAGADPEVADTVRLEVQDRGPGLPSTVRDRFGPASQPEALAAARGSGLGLELARSLVELSGGRLTLLDRPAGGTIARVQLPAIPSLEPSEDAPTAEVDAR